ncbi:MAG TPA: amidohydrolase family protein, partial [Phycisphaerae bacterium]|nr:amidohydrolase family protein [Phycisphaerae bacterium]
MAIVLKNAILLHLDPVKVERGSLRIDGDVITGVGATASSSAKGDDVLDCDSAVVLPGLVNGHTHLYSALATGMPPPPRSPKNFHEILKFIWWRLDSALDENSITASGFAGAVDALHSGTTTLIDHHASPNCIAGSLDMLESAIQSVGLRSLLCYEVTDRNGLDGARAGIEENRRYLKKCAARGAHQFAALAGAHAAFTMSDETLTAVSALGKDFNRGVHIHVAEDPCDDQICRESFNAALVDRLERTGILQPETIIAHCIHLSPEQSRDLSSRIAAVAHNPRSNMNNKVGHAPLDALRNVQLGTDGIGSDMFAEARAAWFKARDARTEITPNRIIEMLAQSARTASRRFNCPLGKLQPGAAADIVVTDYRPSTPLTTENAADHFIFAMSARHVRHVMVAGRWLLKDRRALHIDEEARRDA